MCEKTSAPREVLLSKDSCCADCFLCQRGKCHGDLCLPRWMCNTSREKHTGQFLEREIEDFYKLHFEICLLRKKFSLKVQTLRISLLLWLFKIASLPFFYYGLYSWFTSKSPKYKGLHYPLPCRCDVSWGKKKSQKHKQKRSFKKPIPLCSAGYFSLLCLADISL